MHNDKNNDDDFDALNFDDMDTDESWSGFDGDISEEASSEPGAKINNDFKEQNINMSDPSSDDMGYETASSEKKSILRKHGKLVILSIGILGVGGFAASQFLNQSPKRTVLIENADSQPVDIEASLPNDNTSAVNQTAETTDPYSSLTPLPNLDMQEDDLPDLETALNANESNIEINLPNASGDDIVSLDDELAFEMDEPADLLALEEAAPLEDMELNSETDDDMPQPLLADSSFELEFEDTGNTDGAIIAPPLAPQIEEELNSADAEIEKLQTAINSLENTAAEKQIIPAPIAPAPIEKIKTEPVPVAPKASLEVTQDIASQQKIELAEKLVETEPAPLTPPKPVVQVTPPLEIKAEPKIAPQPKLPEEVVSPKTPPAQPVAQAQPKPVPSTPTIVNAPEQDTQNTIVASVEPKSVEKPKSKVVKPKIVWILRSARPGEASLSEKGSSDFRRVEVGDNVVGLGKIKSIDVVDGKWVVQGTQGRVHQ